MDVRKTAEWLKNIELLHQDRDAVQSRLEEIPQVIERLEELLVVEQKQLTQLQETLKIQNDNLSKLRIEQERIGEELKQSEERATQITNQKEYQAVLKEIESIKKQ